MLLDFFINDSIKKVNIYKGAEYVHIILDIHI